MKLYETDFNRWIEQTAQLLRERRFNELEIDTLIGEIQGLGKSERRSISSQLERLILHLLKWQYQPQRRTDSWLDSINDARLQIQLLLEDSPSLKRYPAQILERTYVRARTRAAKQAELPISRFLALSELSLEQILDADWLPE